MSYDLLVLEGGPCGYVAVVHGAPLGAYVAHIERDIWEEVLILEDVQC